MGTDLTFRPGEREKLKQREQATANQARAVFGLKLREVLSDRNGRDILRYVLRLVAPGRTELAPVASVFNSNAMTMAEQDGEMTPIRKLWETLGELARSERSVMEQEDHDERSTVHTN